MISPISILISPKRRSPADTVRERSKNTPEGNVSGSDNSISKAEEVRKITNQKYEITEIAHEKYPFLHCIRALRDIGSEVKAGALGGFVESEDNLSFASGDDAWIFDDAIVCNDAYVDKGSYLRGNAIACGHAYVSRGTLLAGHARAEDDAYIRGAVLTDHARASGFAVIVYNQDTGGVPMLSGQSAVYGRVSGDVRLTGTALVISGEEIQNDTLDTLVISGQGRSVIRDDSRDELAPQTGQPETSKAKIKERQVER